MLANAALLGTTGILNTDGTTFIDLPLTASPIVSINEGTLGRTMDLESYGDLNSTDVTGPTGVGGLIDDGGYGRVSWRSLMGPITLRSETNSQRRSRSRCG